MRCKKCKRKMKIVGKKWQPASRGPIAGWDVTTYACKCGHKHKEKYSRD